MRYLELRDSCKIHAIGSNSLYCSVEDEDSCVMD